VIKEIKISYMAEFSKSLNGYDFVIVKIRDVEPVEEGMKFGLVGAETLYDVDELRSESLYFRLGRNIPLKLFVQDSSGQRNNFSIDVWKGCPPNLSQIESTDVPGLVLIKLTN